jgi:hypothetical protein
MEVFIIHNNGNDITVVEVVKFSDTDKAREFAKKYNEMRETIEDESQRGTMYAKVIWEAEGF